MDNLSEIERAERIDRYLAGSLGVEEVRTFEAKLPQDEALQREYEDTKMARAVVRNYALRGEIQSIRRAMGDESSGGTRAVVSAADNPASDPKPRTKVRPLTPRASTYVGRIAAGVAILLIGFLGFQYATLSPDSLYAEKAMTYQLAASRATDEAARTPEDRLEQQYQAHQFAEVTATYEQLRDPSPMAIFLAGNAYLQLGQPEPAIRAFREIMKINGSQGINRFEEDAQYYLALSYLKAGRIGEALPLLEAINADADHSYHSSVTDYYLLKVQFLDRIS